ncbi:MAG: GGDEF domain-containing protein [Actinomycetes bacterium]
MPVLHSLEQRIVAAAAELERAQRHAAEVERALDRDDPGALDRLLAARDRHDAARDRLDAATERLHAALLLQRSRRDGLTGALHRDAGLAQLQHELDRSQREGGTLVLAFLDVDGLKSINDTQGHLAGDDALRAVGQALGQCLRTYDVVVRFGGDEFVCALPGLTLHEATERFAQVVTSLDRLSPGTRFSVGLSVALPDDTVERVLARADADLYAMRRARAATASASVRLPQPRGAAPS